ncbi:exocyst complex component 3-like protein 2 [Emydura macquarii macquarii]|uniref:exocyst complex component 3-like protein 2 n=1 Tax=Emydura macquarii macquarii TaxID=1129001 RepID=UPI00352A391B
MPVLKNSSKLKMAKANGTPSSAGELILGKESSTNPFEEDLEENSGDSFLGDVAPGERNPFLEDEEEEEGGGFERNLFNGTLEEHFPRRATLERLVGLSPFRLGKGKKGAGKEKAPNGDRGPERRSFLGRILPLAEGEPRKARRRSEDISLLQRFNGRRKESPASPESCPAERDAEAGKRMSFLKLGLGGRAHRALLADKPSSPEAPEPAPSAQEVETVAKAKEPLSVLEILNLIQQRDLPAADEHIIELEAECSREASPSSEGGEGTKDGSRKTKDVALLYDALMQQLWAVLAEALEAKGTYPPLELVVRVIEQEEAADRRWQDGQGGSAGPRPRAMRRRWAEAVKGAVCERLGRCAEGSGGPLAGHMDRLTRRVVEDLGAVRSHLLPAYPPEYQALAVYARSYHEGLAQLLGGVVQRNLSIAELYFLLDWHSNTYRREVLGRLDIAPLLSAQEQEPLLPPETQRRLEEACVAAVKTKIATDMSWELREEEKRWAQELSREDGRLELSSRVISLLKTHVDRAPQITPEFGERMVLCCLAGLAEFLQSFQSQVERFHEALGESGPPADSYLGRTIAQVNCCPPFRNYVEDLARFGHPESEAPRRQASAALDRVTRLCNRVLAQHLFEELRPYFHKLMKRKWLNSSEAFDAIVALLTDYAQKLWNMQPEPYQALVTEVHRRVLMEYVRPLLQVRLICSSAKMRAKVAARLQEEGRQLQELFGRLKSTSSWLNTVVPHLAEILQLEDTPSIQMEVGMLAQDFPDVRSKHVAALLDVRGLRNQAQRQEILAVLKDLELSEGEAPLCRERAFFSEIPATREVRCFPGALPRLPPARLACLGRLRCWRPGPTPGLYQPPPREQEAEARV